MQHRYEQCKEFKIEIKCGCKAHISNIPILEGKCYVCWSCWYVKILIQLISFIIIHEIFSCEMILLLSLFLQDTGGQQNCRLGRWSTILVGNNWASRKIYDIFWYWRHVQYYYYWSCSRVFFFNNCLCLIQNNLRQSLHV